jgi:hypothetical protein
MEEALEQEWDLEWEWELGLGLGLEQQTGRLRTL